MLLLAGASLLALVAALALAACQPVPSGSPGTSTGTSTTPAATSASTSATGLPSQTDTAWGRIWDALPISFPTPPGALPATDTGDGAKSALLSVPALAPAAIAALYRDGLQSAGYRADIDGPLEDGSFEVRASDAATCVMLVSIVPAGSMNLVTVLYGAGCPFA